MELLTFFLVSVACSVAADPCISCSAALDRSPSPPRGGRPAAALVRVERCLRSWGVVAVGARPIGPVLTASGAAGSRRTWSPGADVIGTSAQFVALHHVHRLSAVAALSVVVAGYALVRR